MGAGAQFGRFGKLTFIHVTDGAASARVARSKGFSSRRLYAAARQQELEAALATAKISADCRMIGYRDLEASFQMAALARRLRRMISDVKPDLIFTHAFEGGHPDHDATAYAVHTAVMELMEPVPIWEFAGYHRDGWEIVRGRFPTGTGATLALCIPLSTDEQALKREMLECFVSQADVVCEFPPAVERLRPAPRYDFAANRPPETLGYEVAAWRIDGHLWRALVVVAERQLRWGVLAGFHLDSLRVRWAMWARRAHPGHPRVMHLMQTLFRGPARDQS
ncbi:MAG: PIG-L family deacetylase [Alphaproteobacteria bacterium]|nr:PIG-L family deacetylase [Alphaproteobacteria bacterium]